MLALLLALAVQAAPGPCDLPPPASHPEPTTAEIYRAVGDGELAAGSRDTAAAAYRRALALDPSNGAARAGLASSCRGPARASDPFQEGLRLMESGDRRGAVAAFRAARTARPSPSAALLEGICLYELGDDAAALPPLREAERDPAHREAASFFLGLVALRAGQGERAASLFEFASADVRFAAAGADLARLARREGRLMLSLLAESGYDSNVLLLPSGRQASGRPGDASAATTMAALARPLGASGPYARAAFSYRDQARLDAYDLLGGSGAVGWLAERAGNHLLAEYAYEYTGLGGIPYLSAHRLFAGGRAALGRIAVGLTWFGRFESFRQASDVPFSGFRQVAEGDAALRIAPRSSIALFYRYGRDDAQEAALSWQEHGPRAEARIGLGADVRLVAEVGYHWRRYPGVDPFLGVARSDTYLDGALRGEMDLGDRWTLRLSLVAQRAWSNVPNLAYVMVFPTFGIAYTIGFL